jgi:hypothetical protein
MVDASPLSQQGLLPEPWECGCPGVSEEEDEPDSPESGSIPEPFVASFRQNGKMVLFGLNPHSSRV